MVAACYMIMASPVRLFSASLLQIQKLYERHKQAPPLPRDAPPVAGNIMWARQLLRRIEIPMRTCVCARLKQRLSRCTVSLLEYCSLPHPSRQRVSTNSPRLGVNDTA